MDKQQALEQIKNHVVLLDVTTNVKLTGGKKNEQQGRITKTSVGINCAVITGKEYQMLMKLHVDPNYVLQPRRWGKRLDNGLIEHNGNFYIECLIHSSGTTTYFQDGEPINKEDIVGLPSNSPSNTEGLVIRTYNIENIDNMY